MFRVSNLILTNKEGLTYKEIMKGDHVEIIREATKGFEMTGVQFEVASLVEDMHNKHHHFPYLPHPMPYPLLPQIPDFPGYHLHTMQVGGGVKGENP